MKKPNKGKSGMREVTDPAELSIRLADQIEVMGPLREAILELLKRCDLPTTPERFLVMMLVITQSDTLVAAFRDCIGPALVDEEAPMPNGSPEPLTWMSPN